MPTYVFTVRDRWSHVQADPIELASLDDAKEQMVATAGEMLKSIGGGFWQDRNWQIDLSDQHGLILCTIMIRGFDAVEPI